ncbi:MAG: glucose-1-phosphate adenylyltransferase [Anaerolineaceae bacterium 4572_78]|nr:MAG: glucose-1-phosphate adenylyltransferase [Anaerolineaceae bacterium 4572_78]
MRVIAIIMAGGAGTRLTALSDNRAKPAVPFAGKFRIIDFTLSNAVNSGIFNVAVLTQYMPHSLNNHIGIGKPWDLDRQKGGVHLRQPYHSKFHEDWYKGTAHAVMQNIDFIKNSEADTVLILSGDHIYAQDYRDMLNFHYETHADLTIAVRNVPLEETDRFGIMVVDEEMHVTDFFEKPQERDKGTLASMGVYIFNADLLIERLLEGSTEDPRIDFGSQVIPSMIGRDKVMSYVFDGYWVDVGTIQSYWETSLELTEPDTPLNLYNPNWVIRTRSGERPPVKIGPHALVQQSLVSNGCVIRGNVVHSVLSPGVYVSPGAIIRDSIILNDTWVGAGAIVDKTIIDTEVIVGSGAMIGMGDDLTANHQMPDKLNTGINVIGEQSSIPAGKKIGRNVLISSFVKEED